MLPVDLRRWAALHAIASILAVATGRASDSGPLPLRDASLLGIAFWQPEPVEARGLPQGDWRFDLELTASNTFTRSSEVASAYQGRSRGPITLDELQATAPQLPLFAFDGEAYLTTLRLRAGLAGGFQAEIQIPLVTQRGGVLDGHIDNFHGFFGLDDAGRNEALRGDYVVYVRNEKGELFRADNPGTGFGDVILSLQKELELSDAGTEIAIRGGLKLPTAREEILQSTGSPDIGVQLIATRRTGIVRFGGDLSASYLGAWDALGLDAQVAWSLGGFAELPQHTATRAIFQLGVSRCTFARLGGEELRFPLVQGAIGIRHRFGRGTTLSAALVENLLFFDNGADITLQFALGRTF